MDDVIRGLDEDELAARRALARRLERIAELDEARLWKRDGATCASGWLAARFGWSRGMAREHVRVARALRDLPRVREALERGLLCWDQLRPLTKMISPEDDALWARRAQDMSPAELWREEERRRDLRPAEAEDDNRACRLHLSWDEERRFLELWGMLPAEQGAAVEKALTERAQEVVLEDGPIEDRGGARLADALEELVTSGGGRPGTPTLVVHAGAEVLAGEAGEAGEAASGTLLCETESGIRLTGEAARRLACDGRIEWVLEEEGRPVGIGRQSRSVPGWLLRLLRHRDRGCRFPGCERASWLKAHHLWHWAQGGPTDLGNLVLLCHAHHRLLHEGGWRTSGHPGRDLRFHRPGGSALRPLSASIRAGP